MRIDQSRHYDTKIKCNILERDFSIFKLIGSHKLSYYFIHTNLSWFDTYFKEIREICPTKTKLRIFHKHGHAHVSPTSSINSKSQLKTKVALYKHTNSLTKPHLVHTRYPKILLFYPSPVLARHLY